MNLRRLLSGAVAAALVFALPATASAQAYPNKAIRIIVPFAPGGATDVVARMVALRLSKAWGQPAIVENKPGASGNIAAQYVAKSPADGYTLLATAAGLMTVNQLIYTNPGFDISEFAPITNVADAPHLLVVNTGTPINSVQDLISLARAKPRQVSFGNSGALSMISTFLRACMGRGIRGRRRRRPRLRKVGCR